MYQLKGYIDMGKDISLIVFDEAHHAVDKHPYNLIMKVFYFDLPPRTEDASVDDRVRPMILGLTASPTYGTNVHNSFRYVLICLYNPVLIFLQHFGGKS